MTTWRLLQTGLQDGSENMRIDQKLAEGLLSGEAGEDPSYGERTLPVLRLYRWRPWAVSIGHHQREEEFDVDRLHQAGIDLVRRPTGGRAVLHAEELTYSVIMPSAGRSVLQVYNAISRALVRGLRRLGVTVALHKAQAHAPAGNRQPLAVPCFASSARYEIEWQGRKLVGSAQRRYTSGEKEVVLQHGSILCGNAHLRLVEFLRLPREDHRKRMRVALEQHTTDLTSMLGRSVNPEELYEPLRLGFEEEWGVDFAGR